MPGPAWGEDSPSDEGRVAAHVQTLLTRLLAEADRRDPPSVAMVHEWHRQIYTGVGSVPRHHYLGSPRGSSHVDLADYEVGLADEHGQVFAEGVPAAGVAEELERFEGRMVEAIQRVDRHLPTGVPPRSEQDLRDVATLAAYLHGEWVRIHPYANGNGRTARTLANWAAMRYGLPPFVRIGPRPDGVLYADVAGRSMGRPPDYAGDHQATVSLFVELLRLHPERYAAGEHAG